MGEERGRKRERGVWGRDKRKGNKTQRNMFEKKKQEKNNKDTAQNVIYFVRVASAPRDVERNGTISH